MTMIKNKSVHSKELKRLQSEINSLTVTKSKDNEDEYNVVGGYEKETKVQYGRNGNTFSPSNSPFSCSCGRPQGEGIL